MHHAAQACSSQKGGWGQKTLRLFFAEPIFAKGMQLKISIFHAFFFVVKQDLVPGIRYYRKSLGMARYPSPTVLIFSRPLASTILS